MNRQSLVNKREASHSTSRRGHVNKIRNLIDNCGLVGEERGLNDQFSKDYHRIAISQFPRQMYELSFTSI